MGSNRAPHGGNGGSWNTFRERTIADLLAAERRYTRSLEAEQRELLKMLEDLARQFYGADLEAQRRADPTGTQAWDIDDWERFFQTATPAAPQVDHADSHRQIVQLEREIQRLRTQVRQLQTEQKTQVAPTAPKSEPSQPPKKLEPPPAQDVKRSASRSQTPPAAAKTDSGAYTPIPAGTDLLAAYSAPLIPLAYNDLEDEFGGLKWRRALLILYLMANYGLSTLIEIGKFVGPREGVKAHSTSIKTPFHKLGQAGLLVIETIKIEHSNPERGFALLLGHLSDKGRAFCQAVGWPPVESEWERLICLHQGEQLREHTMATLYFALLARGRGYTVTLMPEVKAGPTAPDIRVQRGAEQHLVEVELGRHDKPTKWRNLQAVQDHAAICALYPEDRNRLAKDCKLAKIPGVATDLLTIKAVKIGATSDTDPLWLEDWQ